MGKVKKDLFNLLPVVPIVLVGANVNGKPNYMAAAFVNGVNVKPPIVYVSLNKRHHTPKGIIENGAFSINVPSTKYVLETDYCGLVSGSTVDKSNIFTTFYGELGTAPMIEEFPITCECRYTGQSVEFPMDVVYFGEIVQVYASDEVLDGNGRIDVRRADPIYYSGIDRRYRSLDQDMGPAWSQGKQYTPRRGTAGSKDAETVFRCTIIERPAQPTLTIRSRVSPIEAALTIGKSLLSISHYAAGKGYIPAGPPFVAYHDFDGQTQDIEIGFPFGPGIEGVDAILAGEIPGGSAAIYRHVGPYDNLPQVRISVERWLKTNGYETSGPSYEYYLNDPQTTRPENLETEIVYLLL